MATRFPDGETERLSKTRRKQTMIELQGLGEQLLTLPEQQLAAIELADELRQAVRDAQAMKRHDGARRRQIQYIGRLMRGIDVAPIRLALTAARRPALADTARLHRLQRLREGLLADDREFRQWATGLPALDVEHLRSLRRTALLERERGQPPRAYREIFQWLSRRDGVDRQVNDDDATSYD